MTIPLAGLFTLALLTVAFCFATGPSVRAADAEQSSDGAQSITEGREAFESGGSFPWYDGTKDELRPITLPVQMRPWRLPSFNLQWLVWVLLGILLAALIIGIIAIARAWVTGGAKLGTRAREDRVLDADAVEALPFMADRSRTDLLGEARRHYQQGNYNEAIIYLFSYELVRLDKSALIQLTKGKTNRQYLREAGKLAGLNGLLELTMVTFEDVFFGRRPLNRGGFEACWNRLGEFETLLAQTAP